MIAAARKAVALETNNPSAKPVARFLLLARKIHAKFTQQEEQELAARHAAEAAAGRKNAAIMQPVQEVVEFCRILSQTPGLREAFSYNAKDIAARMLNNRYVYSVEEEPIAVRYEVPIFCVDMNPPDGTILSGPETGFLHIGFSPVKIAPAPEKPLDVPTMTAHTFFSRKYQAGIDGRITNDAEVADPIADILAELRARMGHDYFEDVLLPHLEAHQAQ